VKPPPAFSADAAATAFDQLWEAFDRDYAMFALRPEVDWAKLRGRHCPKALASQSTHEFAEVCAEMLRPLRDLHVWLTVAGERARVQSAALGECQPIRAPRHSWGVEGGGSRAVGHHAGQDRLHRDLRMEHSARESPRKLTTWNKCATRAA
jgi:hypothetical protein